MTHSIKKTQSHSIGHGDGACRQNAKSVIADKIKREQKKTEALQIIHDKINWDSLTSRQEEILWSYFI